VVPFVISHKSSRQCSRPGIPAFSMEMPITMMPNVLYGRRPSTRAPKRSHNLKTRKMAPEPSKVTSAQSTPLRKLGADESHPVDWFWFWHRLPQRVAPFNHYVISAKW
jgi:hypothetical protein